MGTVNDKSWDSLITNYIKSGRPWYAITMYQQMRQREPLCLTDCTTYVALLKTCTKLRDLQMGLEIHADIARLGLLGKNLFAGSALVGMYAKCGSLAKASQVFDMLEDRDVVSWTALITGYVEHALFENALHCYEQMQVVGVFPNEVTFVCTLKACGSVNAMSRGHIIHIEIERQGLLERNLHVGSALVDMYSKIGSLGKAQLVFDKLPDRNEVLWNSLIAGYVECGQGDKALECFEQMQLEGVIPNTVTFICILKACGIVEDTGRIEEIHAELENQSLLESDLILGSTLVDMYAKCGNFVEAQEVFDKLPVRNVVSWTALITRYTESGHLEQAIKCYELMQHQGISPNAVTLVCSLRACSSLGATDKAKEIHAEIERQGLLERNIAVGNTLVDMYAKCGSIALAQQVFNKLPVRSVVSWTALMAGHAQIGESEAVFHSFDKMLAEDTKPNFVTFIVLLRGCTRAGLSKRSQMYFDVMSKEYGIVPSMQHQTWVLDLLGRTGRLDKALAMIKKMPICPSLVMLRALLGSCRNCGHKQLGKQAFEHALHFGCHASI